jgi:hypothetical protein
MCKVNCKLRIKSGIFSIIFTLKKLLLIQKILFVISQNELRH